jgi:hypothetical protein
MQKETGLKFLNKNRSHVLFENVIILPIFNRNEQPCGKTAGYLNIFVTMVCCHSCGSRNPGKTKKLDSASSAE